MSEIRVKTEFSAKTIKQRLESDGDFFLPETESRIERVLQLQEEGVRQALKKLGWLPPEEASEQQSLLDQMAEALSDQYEWFLMCERSPSGNYTGQVTQEEMDKMRSLIAEYNATKGE
jgi:hypothetical protein